MEKNPVKIMVVDDEEGILDFMQRALRFRGYETCGSADGEEAILIFDRENPAIALIDVQLNDSKVDGLGVLAHIKKNAPGTICLMITRITEPEAMDKAKALGAERYLLKPLDTRDVVQQVAEAVRLLEGR